MRSTMMRPSFSRLPIGLISLALVLLALRKPISIIDQSHLQYEIHKLNDEQHLQILNNNDCQSIIAAALHNVSTISSTTVTAAPAPPKPLRDIHMVMMGDSLMRYQYLSLAYRLRYGVWFNESLWHFNLVNEKTFENPYHEHHWGEFLFQTNRLLHPNEVCDCRRNPDNPSWKLEIIENRYYYDPVLNNSLVYLLAFGHYYPVKGRLEPHQVRNQTRDWQTGVFRDYTSIQWQHRDWSDVIRNHISHLQPQPRHIILNAGFWEHQFGWTKPSKSNKKQATNQSDAASASNGTKLISISKDTETLLKLVDEMPQYQFAWRTTTYSSNRRGTSVDSDHVMCERLATCVNVSFTRRVRENLFWDKKHFLEPVYRVENEEMLHLFGYLPDDYIRMNVTEILE